MMVDIRFSSSKLRERSILRFRLRVINHHPGDYKSNDELPCACERYGRGQILTWEHQLVQGNGGEIGPAHLFGHNKLDEGIEIRSQQSSTPGLGKECPELVNIFCLKL